MGRGETEPLEQGRAQRGEPDSVSPRPARDHVGVDDRVRAQPQHDGVALDDDAVSQGATQFRQAPAQCSQRVVRLVEEQRGELTPDRVKGSWGSPRLPTRGVTPTASSGPSSTAWAWTRPRPSATSYQAGSCPDRPPRRTSGSPRPSATAPRRSPGTRRPLRRDAGRPVPGDRERACAGGPCSRRAVGRGGTPRCAPARRRCRAPSCSRASTPGPAAGTPGPA
jgi:hypothetical protein